MWQRVVSLGIIAAMVIWPGSTLNAAGDANTGPLGLKVPAYDVQGVSIIEALRQLKLSVPEKTLMLTLEVAPFEQEPEKNLTLALRSSTVKDVLDRIMRLDPRYTYSVFRGGINPRIPGTGQGRRE